MTDQLQQDLASLFEATATDAEVPPLPLAQVVAQGRSLQQVRRRRTALWSVAAAAVAVVAVIVPVAVSAHHSAEGPAPAHHSQTPSRDAVPTTPTTLPHLDGHTLHVGDRDITLRGNPGGLISAGNTSIYLDQKSERWWRVRTDGAEVEPFGPPWGGDTRPWEGWFQPTLSPDGGTVAVLTHPTRETSRITTFDTDGQEEIAHVDIGMPYAPPSGTGTGSSIALAAVTDAGYVVWYASESTGTSSWIWSPAAKQPVPLQPGLDVDANGMVRSGPPNGVIARGEQLVRFSPTGKMQPVNGLPPGFDPAGATWSASGSVVATDSADGPQIAHLGAHRDPVRPPSEFTILDWFAFESDDDVIGAATVDSVPSLVRCATDRSACAVISKLPANWQSWRWAASPPTGTETATDGAISASAAPSLDATGLHVGTQTFDVNKNDHLLTAGDTVLVGHWGKQPGDIAWRVLRGGRLAPLPYARGDIPVLSPDGTRVVVFTNPTPQTSRITMYDARTDAQIDHVDLDLPATCCDGGSVQMLSVDAQGTVHWVEERDGGGAPEMTWRPGSAPVKVGNYAG